MPNNPIRFKAGYTPIAGASLRMKRKEFTQSIRTTNRIRATTDLGAVNGGPAAVAVSTPSANTPFDDPYGNPLGDYGTGGV